MKMRLKKWLGPATLLLALAMPAGAGGAEPRTIEMTVDGMVCAFCAQGIEKKLRGLPATDDVYISLEHHLVAMSLKKKGDVSDAKLKDLLTEAGYTVKSVKRSDQPLAKIRSRAQAS
jgi:copper chaperone CopZ